ncbi:FCD domain-containing protein [Aquincola sp. MAHUQ-54]|uniref:FCD domain-containing protein n=1 Tax=Aquincola agrisoli TaxID=3119538 RepID=A0AAW9QAX7_9BURK
MDAAATLRDALFDQLRTGALRPGHRLPPERELSEQYGISRSTVRRVLGQLKAQQLITQTVGSGTYVTAQAATVASAPAALSTSPAELMEARLAMEPAIVEMVIRNATAADFQQMEACCSQAEAAATLEEFEHWDGALHEAIAKAAHNSFVTGVFQSMNAVRAQGEWGMLKRRSVTPERRAAYQREHRALVAALKDRDLAAAVQHTRAHLLHVRRNLLGD